MGDEEQVLGAILWQYIEQLRQSRPEPGPGQVVLTQEQLAELVGMLATAKTVQAALEDAPGAAVRSAVCERVLGEPAGRAVAPRRAARFVPLWQFAMAVVALVAALLLSVSFRPAGQRLPHELLDRQILAVTCRDAKEHLEQLVHGDLPPERALNYWYHFIKCRPCLEKLREHTHEHARWPGRGVESVERRA